MRPYLQNHTTMKLVFVIRSLNVCGGIERATIQVANALSQRGYEVSLVSMGGADTKPFFEVNSNIPIFYLAPDKDKYPAVVRDIRRIVLLRRYYKQTQPDLIILAGATRSIVNIPAARGYKVISWEHAALNHKQYAPLIRLSRRLSAHHSRCVVALTQHDADGYKRQYGAKCTVVIPNPLVLQNPERSSLQGKIVVAVGRLVPIKGFDNLLRAWQQVKAPDWKLRIVGSGRSEEALFQQIVRDKIERVEMIPMTADVATQYRQASIYVCSSRSESFGLVLTEAMSVGLPVISFDCGAGPREIVQNGVNGFLVPAGDTKQMAERLEQLMADFDLRQKMGQSGFEYVQKYNVDTVLAQWEELLQKVYSEP